MGNLLGRKNPEKEGIHLHQQQQKVSTLVSQEPAWTSRSHGFARALGQAVDGGNGLKMLIVANHAFFGLQTNYPGLMICLGYWTYHSPHDLFWIVFVLAKSLRGKGWFLWVACDFCVNVFFSNGFHSLYFKWTSRLSLDMFYLSINILNLPPKHMKYADSWPLYGCVKNMSKPKILRSALQYSPENGVVPSKLRLPWHTYLACKACVLAFKARVYSQCKQDVWVCESLLLVTALVMSFFVGRFLVELFSQSGYPKRSTLYQAANHQRTILVLKPHVFHLFRWCTLS